MATKYSVHWAEPALLDAQDIVDYLVVQGSELAAEKLVTKLEGITDRLEHFPERGRIVPELRREGISSYYELVLNPYRLIYRIYAREVAIVAFLDGRRDLGELLVARAMR